ncbi:MAG: hypothetical protein ACPLX8_00890 [Nanopusillaceae archaeon]
MVKRKETKTTKEYLALKNKIFFDTAVILDQKGELRKSLYLLVPDNDDDPFADYFSLVGLYFKDEEGYQRSIFIPLPVVQESKTLGAKKIRRVLKNISKSHIVSREWHDIMKIESKPPTSERPSKRFLKRAGNFNNF